MHSVASFKGNIIPVYLAWFLSIGIDVFFNVPGFILIKSHEEENTVNYVFFGAFPTYNQRTYQSAIKILERQSKMMNCVHN